MIKEAFNWARELVQGYQSPEFLHLDGDPPHKHYIRQGGQMVPVYNDPKTRFVHAKSLKALLNLATGHFDKGVAEAGRMAIFYGEEQVRLVFDTENGREVAVFNPPRSREFDFFDDCLDQPTISVPELRVALSRDLYRCFSNKDLVKQVGQLDFEDRRETSVTSRADRESLSSRAIEEAKPTAELPGRDQIFSVRMYDTPELPARLSLLCHLEPDLASRQWWLRPDEESWSTFTDNHLNRLEDKIREQIEEEGLSIPIYRGIYTQ